MHFTGKSSLQPARRGHAKKSIIWSLQMTARTGTDVVQTSKIGGAVARMDASSCAKGFSKRRSSHTESHSTSRYESATREEGERRVNTNPDAHLLLCDARPRST